MTESIDHALTAADEEKLVDLRGRLSLAEKVRLLTGRDFWTTWPIEKIGLRRMLVSDGPSGVRGEVWDERSPSLNLPSASALSSSWDPLIAERYGAASAVEARRKGVDVVLGPTINLHRSPLGGRHFEAFSEDPTLTGELAAAYVRGVQSNGVGATPKHYIANDFETQRFTADVVVSDRALRELYLLAFEKAIVESHAWLVMSSYNSINGATATENELLERPLNSEWGFDGVVVSDWTGVRSTASANFSQDLAMPGPVGAWGDALVAAVEAGEVSEEAIDRKVLRLLRLAARVGALEGFDHVAFAPVVVEDGRSFAREAATRGSVLLANSGILPLAADSVGSIAVIGHNALHARSQGGGSATVVPERVISPLAGIEAAYPGASVSYSLGAIVQQGVAELPLDRIENPVSGTPGLHARFVDATGNALHVEDRMATNLVWFGGDVPIQSSSVLELSTVYSPESTGAIRIGFATLGRARVFVDGGCVLDATLADDGEELGAGLLAPPSASVEIQVERDVAVALRLEYDIPPSDGALGAFLSITLGIEPNDSAPQALIAEAVAAAAAADVAIVVVGTNSKVESEGFDRSSLALPGHQDELVAAVVAANPRTIVVVNSGSPVLMPWRDDVEAVLLTYFAGQEYGDALADILVGAVEPGGRLPTTWPATQADLPVFDVTPVDGVLRYDEGIHIGYRAWLRAGTRPAYPFGHGLGYTTWRLSGVKAQPAVTRSGVDVTVSLANTGSRDGRHVVQVYAARPDSAVDRPVRWLVGFASAWVAAGETATVRIAVPSRAFANWSDGWQYEPGAFTLLVGSSVDDLPLEATVIV